MESDSVASSTIGWALAVAPHQQEQQEQQQQQESSSSSSQFFPATGFPCSIASLFEATASQGQQQRQEEQQGGPPSEGTSLSSNPQAEPTRFFLEYVILENFKSYRGRHVIGPLQSSVAIIGANGKSNIADAICFALGVTGRRLRSSALMDLRHGAGQEPDAPLAAAAATTQIAAAATKATAIAAVATAEAAALRSPCCGCCCWWCFCWHQSNEPQHALNLIAGQFEAFVSACVLCLAAQSRTAVSLHFVRRSAPAVPGEALVLRRQISSSSSSSSSSTYSVDGVRVSAEEYRQVLHDRLSLGPHTLAASLLLQGDSSVTNAARSPLELARLIERIGSSEDWAEQFAAAESRAATLRRQARIAFTSKQQLLASLRVLQAQKKEVNSYQEMHHKLTERQVEYLLFQLYMADRQAARQSQIEKEERQKSEELVQQLQETLQRAEMADRQRIAVSLQLDQKKTLARKQSLKTGMLHTDLVECLERRRFAEQQLEQQQIKLQQKQQECVKLRNLEQELSSELIRVSKEQQRITADIEAQDSSLGQRLTQKQHEQLLQLQQQADGRLADLRQQLASKQPLLIQANSSLDVQQQQQQQPATTAATEVAAATAAAATEAATAAGTTGVAAAAASASAAAGLRFELERECLELHRRIACLRELEGEAQQKHTTAAEALQQLLREAATVKQAITEANEQSKTSGARREELRALQEDLKQQLSLVRGLQHDSQQQQQLLQLYEDLRSKAQLQDTLFGTAGECCAPSNKRFSAAVAAAVGRWKHALITKDVATANAVIQYLKTNCLQAIDLLPLDRLRQQQQRSSRRDLEDLNEEGGTFFEPPSADTLPPQCSWAVDCVACDSQLRPVVENLRV
ncbi:hypothetical protein ACSSS7_003947 [Eimeria intestinalis]